MKKFSLFLCILLMLSLLGCGAQDPSAETDPRYEPVCGDGPAADPTDPTEPETFPEIHLEYAPPALGCGPDGSEYLISTKYYDIILPEAWNSTCVTQTHDLENGSYSVDIYEYQSLRDFGGGKLCTLMMVPTDDETYKDFPDYILLCALDTPEGSFYVIALFPTDVQFTEETMNTYNEMSEQLMDVLYTLRPRKGIEMAMP